MNRLLLSLVCLSVLCPIWAAEEDERAELAWQMAWSRFYCPSTCMFYDYLSSYEPGFELAHLPVPDEVHRQYPNPCGYGTGMEDCMILGGTMFETVVDRYRVTADTALHAQASAILQGITYASSIRGLPALWLVASLRPMEQAITSIRRATNIHTLSMAYGSICIVR